MKNNFLTISLAEKLSLIQRVMKLYEVGALNQRVMTRANYVIENTYVPSQKEIDAFENDTVPIPIAKPINPHSEDPTIASKYIGTTNLGLVWIYPYLNDKPIKFGKKILQHKFEYDLLSPANDSTSLNIENMAYPSISHYMVVKVAQTIPGFENICRAYSIISNSPNSYFSVDDSENRLKSVEQQYLRSKKYDLLHKALFNKFEKRKFKDVLLASGKYPIEYSSLILTEELKKERLIKLTDILSESDLYRTQTVNFLHKIRTTILPENLVIVDNSDIKSLFEYDDFMEMYLTEKVLDISFTIKCIQIFCKHKNVSFDLTECFVRNILETFYGDCTPDGMKLQKKLKLYPYRFESILLSQFKIKTKAASFALTQKSAQLIFNKLLKGLTNLRFILSNGDPPIVSPLYNTVFKMALIQGQWLLNKQRTDLRFRTKNKNKTIISALIQVIFLLHTVLDDCDPFVTDVDIKVAASILTGKIQPISEIKELYSTRSQLIAETEFDEDEETDIDEVEVETEEEEREVDYEEEIPDFDENDFYEGVTKTITAHFESLKLDACSNIELEIKNAAKTVSKEKENMLKIHYYA